MGSFLLVILRHFFRLVLECSICLRPVYKVSLLLTIMYLSRTFQEVDYVAKHKSFRFFSSGQRLLQVLGQIEGISQSLGFSLLYDLSILVDSLGSSVLSNESLVPILVGHMYALDNYPVSLLQNSSYASSLRTLIDQLVQSIRSSPFAKFSLLVFMSDLSSGFQRGPPKPKGRYSRIPFGFPLDFPLVQSSNEFLVQPPVLEAQAPVLDAQLPVLEVQSQKEGLSPVHESEHSMLEEPTVVINLTPHQSTISYVGEARSGGFGVPN